MALRITGGDARGRELRQPRGATRPTSARLREALFSMLTAGGMLRSPVIDLYAGSGALGIEALSRGLTECVFVESDRRTCEVIDENLRHVQLDGGRVVLGRVGHWQPAADERYALVLADPPYDDAAPWASIEATIADALTEDAAIAVEHAARRTPREELAGRPLWRDRKHGDSAIAIYRPGSASREDTE